MINLSSDKPTQTVFVHRESLRCVIPRRLAKLPQRHKIGVRMPIGAHQVSSILWLACRIQPCDCDQCYIAN